jgi:Protein of unknown function (DUF2652)/Polyketide cyclase / dehydrase and lipid transport
MLNASEPACLVIADISGYTSYLAGVELDHAQDILADLMDTVVTAFRPTFRLAKLEGDAAFVYAMGEAVDGSALQDTIERTYFAFRRRLRDIGQASLCDCNACMRMPELDLKVVAHHGTIARHRIAGREELAGRPVIEVHRLLKNEVVSALGISAYAIYSEACIRAMGLADPAAAGLIEHHETYDYLGEITLWVRDLHAAWTAETQRTRVFVEEKDAILAYSALLPAPPAVAWEYQTSPVRRPEWQYGVERVNETAVGGRRGVGTTNHCVHGKDAIVEEILDWRPFDYWTQRMQVPMPGIPKLILTYAFQAAPGGTTLRAHMLRPRTAKDRAAFATVESFLKDVLQRGVDTLIVVLHDEMERRSALAAGVVEPALPVSAGRFEREPVDSAGAHSSS